MVGKESAKLSTLSDKPNDRQKMIVKTGSTILAENNFEALTGARIGFVGNHTSRLADGSSTLSGILTARVCDVVRLFAPEHGAFGAYDDSVLDEIDPSTGLTVHSLYGENRKPTPETLRDIEYLVVELQDVGARFYTYSATLLLAIAAAAENNTTVIVLDRPNPINGNKFEGPLADASQSSFVAPYTIPVRTGLTLGELGRLFAIETGCSDWLKVIPMQGWKRSMYFDDTALNWIAPSPAMRSLSTAIVYPGVCLLEQTNISVGRGTDYPFEIIGAPFVNGEILSAYLIANTLPGVEIRPYEFMPTTSKYIGELCGGVRIHVTDRLVFDALRLGITLMTALRDLYGSTFTMTGASHLLANDNTMGRLLAGETPDDITNSWRASLRDWNNRRQACMLYGE
jgi:uncharacterized protein YbbC (DUF1343 family)